MDVSKEMENVKKIINEVLEVTKASIGDTSDPSKIQDMSLDEIDGLLSKVQGLIDKLNQQSDRLLQDMGMTKEQMSAFVENPGNFTKEQWELIQYMKNEAERFQKSVSQTFDQKTDQKNIDSNRSDQKNPRIGGKKNWMAS
ncbi:MAG: hypothetical protein JHC93_02550 [Parachlamydiales bacterium]|nr:hypothetical protein [Parachlamydiales bacterium]